MDKSIRELAGIGPKRAELFEKKGITTVSDLLHFFPRSYEDRSVFKEIAQCTDNETVCLDITVSSPVKEYRVRANMLISSMKVSDDTGVMNVVWYNNRFVKKMFRTGESYALFGKVTRNKNNKTEIVNPVIEKKGENRFTGIIVPIYPLTEGLTQNLVCTVMRRALESYGEIAEYIPDEIRERYSLAQINYAIKNIHFPKSAKAFEIARRRLVFEELLTLRLSLALMKSGKEKKHGIIIKPDKAAEFEESLPYALTRAQKRVINEICTDMADGTAMNRLIQGDVGSGKTAVAAAAIYTVVKNGFQAALMAPTEILAAQHKASLDEFFGRFGFNTVLLTGKIGAAKRKEVLAEIADGRADVIVGTHALISEGVEFKNLSLAVTDEQHRFGVAQRAALSAKGSGAHILVMSATPIPRTLALILYGDLDISVIDELPPGRKPVKTYAVGERMRKRVYAFMEKNISEGAQAYVVCPLIEETQSGLKNASDIADLIQKRFPAITTGLIHGKMKPSEKDDVMTRFAEGKIDVLVSTTVIEVGVNVPNASLMIIENAERFGLSQLHQLRGRVGRGSKQASCILIAHGKNPITRKRMETMTASNDGFYISEQDLKLRGPGDFFGTRQHGLPDLKIANLFTDTDILTEAQQAAAQILKRDPNMSSPEYAALKSHCGKIITDNTND